jgi:hypothetical protein
LLPSTVHTISNKEGVHGAITYCFRNQSTVQSTAKVVTKGLGNKGGKEEAQDTLDLALNALKVTHLSN